MTITIQRFEARHVPAAGRICYEAFGALQDRHGVERDFDSAETATMVVGLFASRADFAGFVAVDEKGDVVGSNFLGFSDAVAGVGPITVRPDVQAGGVGRMLMLAVMDEAKRRGIGQVRLMQEAINTASLSLYTKLGFDWRECCVLLRAAPAAQDDARCRPVTERDLATIDAISKRHYHATRVNEVAGYLKMQLPGFVMAEGGKDVGYYFPSFLGHGFAGTAEQLASLVCHTARRAPAHFHKTIVPLGEHALHRALMERGCQAVKMFNYMTVGEYRRPLAAWIPSIGM